jgi:hypothetical protein
MEIERVFLQDSSFFVSIFERGVGWLQEMAIKFYTPLSPLYDK